MNTTAGRRSKAKGGITKEARPRILAFRKADKAPWISLLENVQITTQRECYRRPVDLQTYQRLKQTELGENLRISIG